MTQNETEQIVEINIWWETEVVERLALKPGERFDTELLCGDYAVEVLGVREREVGD